MKGILHKALNGSWCIIESINKTFPIYGNPDDLQLVILFNEPVIDLHNKEVEYETVLFNPMGRKVDFTSTDINTSSCEWYAELISPQQK